MTLARTVSAGLMIAALAAGTAIAKGHDQSGTATPGTNVGAETVAGAQGLGKNPDQAADTRGKSANAGKKN